LGALCRAGSLWGADGARPGCCAAPASPQQVLTAEQKRTRKIRSHLSGCVPVLLHLRSESLLRPIATRDGARALRTSAKGRGCCGWSPSDHHWTTWCMGSCTAGYGRGPDDGPVQAPPEDGWRGRLLEPRLGPAQVARKRGRLAYRCGGTPHCGRGLCVGQVKGPEEGVLEDGHRAIPCYQRMGIR